MTYSLAFSQSLYIVLLIAAKVQLGQFDFVPTQRISEVLAMSPATVASILRRLHRAGLIETREGANGGVRLARPPAELTVLDVFHAIEQEHPLFQKSALSGDINDKTAKVQQIVGSHLGALEESMKQNLKRITIANLLTEIN